jgi:carbonic anhydrase
MDDIAKFIKGFARFQQQYFSEEHSLYQQLGEGQHPTTLLIGCCDSRVDPMLLTGSDPGEMFVVRNVANLVPPCTADSPPGVSSAIEFAVCNLLVERVIILGHAHCGGIRALLTPEEKPQETDFVGRWMKNAEPVREQILAQFGHKSLDEQHQACELASILHSLDNLLTYPWLKKRVEQGNLTLHGWYFDIHSGALLAYSKEEEGFSPLVCPLDLNQQRPGQTSGLAE